MRIHSPFLSLLAVIALSGISSCKKLGDFMHPGSASKENANPGTADGKKTEAAKPVFRPMDKNWAPDGMKRR